MNRVSDTFYCFYGNLLCHRDYRMAQFRLVFAFQFVLL